jgi:hypothetical protein
MRAAARALLAGVALATAGCAHLHGPDRAPVTPQRPTFSKDTNTTARGTLELEAGFAAAPDESVAVPVELKWGAGDLTEVFVGASLYDWVELESGQEFSGHGDTYVGARQRLYDPGGPHTAALQFTAKFPTAEETGSGESDFLAAAIYSLAAAEDVGVTVFYEAGWLGRPDNDGVDLQHALSLSAGKTFDDTVGIAGELVGIDGVDGDPVFMTLAVQHILLPSLVWDAGFQVGLNDDASDLRFQVGFVSNLGRLY